MAAPTKFIRNLVPHLSRVFIPRQRIIVSQPMRCVTIYHSKDQFKPTDKTTGAENLVVNKQPVEDEKYLSDLQRGVQIAFKQGDYDEALKLAIHAQEEMQAYFGVDHPVNASAWNNIAIMNKKLQYYDAAINAYLKAIHTYRSAAGEKHPQYVSTLSNLGLCFQAAALSKKQSLEKLPLLERCLETFEEVLKLRNEVEISYSDSGGSHISTLAQAKHHYSLALFYLDNEKNHNYENSKKKYNLELKNEIINNAIKDTLHYVSAVRERSKGKSNIEVATSLNNLGFIYKCAGEYAKSRPCYEEALELRTKLLGKIHPDTIATKYNLAELLRSSGDEDDAIKLQNEILDELDVDVEACDEDDDVNDDKISNNKTASNGVGVIGEDFFKDKPTMQ